MKVLHVEAGRNLYGGARQVQYLISGLQTRGVSNLLAVPAGSALAAAATESGARVFEMPMGGDLDLGLILRLARVMRRERPDIVHLHSRRGADLLGGIAARLAGLPAVLSRRVDNPEPRWLVRIKYPLFHRVIAISEGIRRVLLSEGVSPERLVCVRSAVDAAAYGSDCDPGWFRQEFGLPTEARVIGVAAQLIPRKGHRFLLQAMPDLLQDHPDLHLLLFGRGPAESDIRSQIATLGIQHRVRLTGFRDDLARILPCLDLLVHPALIEGLGVALLQAASSGLPIVASDAGGMPEAVRDGINGLLVPPGESPALAKAIGRLLADPELAAGMGRAGQQLMQREFSIDGMVEGNLRVYTGLLQ